MSAKIVQTAWVPTVDPAEVTCEEETVEFWLCLAEDFEAEGNVAMSEWALERAVDVEQSRPAAAS